MSSMRQGRFYSAGTYLLASLLPLGVIAALMRLWTLDLSLPFDYTGDAVYTAAAIKNFLETNSLYINPSLGAPGFAEWHDFPGADALNYLWLWILGRSGMTYGAVMNLFYLSGYALSALSVVFVLRRLGISRLSALTVAVLFALLPAHWFRSESHLFIGMYWIVPLVLLVIAWVDSSKPPLFDGGGRLPRLRDGRAVAALAIAAGAAACGVYYFYFTVVFLTLAGLIASVRRRTWRPVASAVVLVGVGVTVFLVQMLPTIAYLIENGRNTFAVVRNPGDAEVYGLRITHMFLPHEFHRIPALAAIDRMYLQFSANADNEGRFAALGIVASFGFLVLVLSAVVGWPREHVTESDGDGAGTDLELLGRLTVGGFLLSTVAGLGAVLAGAVTTLIRSYNRISVFIALFALTALAILVDRVAQRRSGRGRRTALAVFLAATIAIGIFDQTPADMTLAVANSHRTFQADAALGRVIQTDLPQGAAIFQLPYIAFPEAGHDYPLPDYEQLRGPLHTTGLRWSFGAIKGRPLAAWQEEVAALPIPEMIARLRGAGFSALWVNLVGYRERASALFETIRAELGYPFAQSADGVIAVWRLDATTGRGGRGNDTLALRRGLTSRNLDDGLANAPEGGSMAGTKVPR